MYLYHDEPKKGLDDFVELARRFHDAGIHCVLIGLDDAHVAALRSRQGSGEVPGNLILDGYAASPVIAMRRADVTAPRAEHGRSLDRSALRRALPPARESAADVVRNLRDDERY